MLNIYILILILLSALSTNHALPRLCTEFGECAFSHAGPLSWNALSEDIHVILDSAGCRRTLYFSGVFNVCIHSVVSVLQMLTTPGSSTTQVANVRPTGYLCCWPMGLELIAWQLERFNVSRDSFRKLLKTHLFTLYWSIQRIRGFTKMHYSILLLTYIMWWWWWW